VVPLAVDGVLLVAVRFCHRDGEPWRDPEIMRMERAVGVRAACDYLVSEKSGSEFIGEPVYVPYFWTAYESSTYEEDMSNTVTINVRDADRRIFPELRDVDQVMLFQDDEGRVHLA
jgi:hypothetical protein